MPRRSRQSKAFPPLFVLRAGESCPECGEGSTFDDMVLLQDIDYLPRHFLALLTARRPG